MMSKHQGSSDDKRKAFQVRIIDQPIDAAALWREIADDDCGAQVVFQGSTRRTTDERITLSLEYDAYRPMAESEIQKIVDEAMNRWPLSKVVVIHRLGVVPVGEASIAVAIASPHRLEAFESVAWIMDRIKADVPIWKKEHWHDGTDAWIHGTKQ